MNAACFCSFDAVPWSSQAWQAEQAHTVYWSSALRAPDLPCCAQLLCADTVVSERWLQHAGTISRQGLSRAIANNAELRCCSVLGCALQTSDIICIAARARIDWAGGQFVTLSGRG